MRQVVMLAAGCNKVLVASAECSSKFKVSTMHVCGVDLTVRTLDALTSTRSFVRYPKATQHHATSPSLAPSTAGDVQYSEAIQLALAKGAIHVSLSPKLCDPSRGVDAVVHSVDRLRKRQRVSIVRGATGTLAV